MTLASLFEHSGAHIGTVWFQEERGQRAGPPVGLIPQCFPDRRFEHVIAHRSFGWNPNDPADLVSAADRRSIRYQEAWERTDKTFLFVTHNDCRYFSDIVGGMLDRLADGAFTGVGLIGQCWNCPASRAGLCAGHRHELYTPTYDELAALIRGFPTPRTTIGIIDSAQPSPLPECRLNEFACLINVAKCRSAVLPEGDVKPFGYMGLDTGADWFRGLRLRGHRFLNWAEGLHHAPFSSGGNGHAADTDQDEYAASEEKARTFLAAHYPAVLDRLMRLSATLPA